MGTRTGLELCQRSGDPHYETVLSAHDPDEKTLDGGQLWTRYGKGVYIFTAYSWFRQLPAGRAGRVSFCSLIC